MLAPTAARARGPRSIGAFAMVAAGVIAILAALLALAFHGPSDRRAIVISATLALIVQVASYAIARVAVSRPKRPIIIAWAAGMILRFAAVVAYAMLATYVWSLPPVPALLSFVVFLFVSTLLEPWLLHSQ